MKQVITCFILILCFAKQSKACDSCHFNMDKFGYRYLESIYQNSQPITVNDLQWNYWEQEFAHFSDRFESYSAHLAADYPSQTAMTQGTISFERRTDFPNVFIGKDDGKSSFIQYLQYGNRGFSEQDFMLQDGTLCVQLDQTEISCRIARGPRRAMICQSKTTLYRPGFRRPIAFEIEYSLLPKTRWSSTF